LTGLDRHTTEELLLLGQQGDALAFERLYRTTAPLIWAFAQRRGPARVSADDVTQEVFCRLWEGRCRFAGRSPATTFLFGIAQNILREHVRGADDVSPIPNNIAEMVAAAAPLEPCDNLAAARNRLSEVQAQAVRYVYDDQMTPDEAAARLGCTRQAVRRRLQEALHQLRRNFQSPNRPSDV
jgi:RNA polymerase sigma-70 factor (ECF subfamily)